MVNDIIKDKHNNQLTWSAGFDDIEFMINVISGASVSEQQLLYQGPNLSCSFENFEMAKKPVLIVTHSKKHHSTHWEKGVVKILE